MHREFRIVFFILILFSFILSACSPDDGSAPQVPEQDLPVTGEEELRQIGQFVYTNHCAACHQDDGRGQLPQYPGLDGNQSVMADPHPVIDVVLHGRDAMPPFGGILSDEEIAGVVTYIRSAWTNIAAPVEPQTVQEVR